MKVNKVINIFAAAFCIFLLFSCQSLKIEKEVTETGSIQEILHSMTLEEKVGQLFLIQPDQLDLNISLEETFNRNKKPHYVLNSQMQETLTKYPVGGIIFFAKNIKNPRQLKKYVKELNSSSKIPLVFSVDEEGGRVVRLARNKRFGLKNVGPMLDVGNTGETENAKVTGEYIASYLSEYGITLDFAPVADVNTNPQNIVIGDRAFGSDPVLVSKMVGAFLEGLHNKGLKGCLKHFPGHGDTKDDTHADYVIVKKDWKELDKCELIPFKENLEKADSIMLAHVTLSALGKSSLPSSLSKEVVTQKLRNEMGYEGIILTDALSMGAIVKNYGSGEAAILAFEAGNDFLLMPYDFVEAHKALLEAVESGRISEKRVDESLVRILKLKGYK